MKIKFVADLHNHSIFSDGELRPEELIEMYSNAHYKALAITDHDTIEGALIGTRINSEKKENTLSVIPGVELSLGYNNSLLKGTLHLLLYFKDELFSDHIAMEKFNFVFSHCRGKALIRKRIISLNRYLAAPHRLKEEDFQQFAGQITRRTFYIVLTQKGLPQDEARELLSNDSPAYIPSGIEPSVAIETLKDLPLIKVLAHPGAGSAPEGSHYRETSPPLEIVRQLAREIHKKFHIDGVELFYPAHTPELRQAIIDMAEAMRIRIFTGGSDCHDMQKRPPFADGLGQEEWEKFLKLWKNL